MMAGIVSDDDDGNHNGEVEEGQVVEYDGSIKSTSRTPRNSDMDATSERQQSSRRRMTSGGGGGSQQQQQGQPPFQQHRHSILYGIPMTVRTSGHFPNIGSTLGPYFCLGQLGKGTFSSIHKCIDLAYYPPTEDGENEKEEGAASAGGGDDALIKEESTRLAAAKVELTTFQQSGVLESEAMILEFLHRSLPPHSVPVYLGHYRSQPLISSTGSSTTAASAAPALPNQPPAAAAEQAAAGAAAAESNQQDVPQLAAALVMEYLPGDDMHQLRENVMKGRTSRRIDLEDAITLTADVMLPLLRNMHSVGIIHRDVKPSNCVLRSSSSSSSQKTAALGKDRDKVVPDFCLVDFGLSKSILVPEDSSYADRERRWPDGKDWLKPRGYAGGACYRKERERAEFRGTSMYAGLRVHQLRDYCPRDDMYSLLYVFCDLVSGGLPWMSYAATRDRNMCQTLKERVHGDKTEGDEDETELLLMGDGYHIATYRRDQQLKQQQQQGQAPSENRPNPIEIPEPLSMSRDPRRVGLLRRAFEHLSKLQFWDMPDYGLIHNCIRGFRGNDRFKPSPVPRIDWNVPQKLSERWRSNLLGANRYLPKGSIPEDSDPLEEDIFDEMEDAEAEKDTTAGDDLAVLPVELRFRLAQMEYHASRPSTVPPTIALRDWMKVTFPLLYGEWDTPKYEGRHRTSSDGLKRDLYLRLLKSCYEWSSKFDHFQSRPFHPQLPDTSSGTEAAAAAVGGSNHFASGDPRRRFVAAAAPSTGGGPGNCSNGAAAGMEPESKRRKTIDATATAAPGGRSCAIISRALYGLRQAIKDEEAKKSATQATRLSFA